MDANDTFDDGPILAQMKRIQEAALKAAQRKGEMVSDHPSVMQLVVRHMLRVEIASQASPGDHRIYTTQVPAPYPPCILPEDALEPIAISQMRLETHHRGRKIMLRVCTPPQRITAVMAVVEDENHTGVLLQLYHQPDEALVPTIETLGPDMICILKEPFFKCATDGSYSLRVDHPSDIIWLNAEDERIPQKWRPKFVELNQDSKRIREQGNDAVKNENWSEALKLYVPLKFS